MDEGGDVNEIDSISTNTPGRASIVGALLAGIVAPESALYAMSTSINYSHY